MIVTLLKVALMGQASLAIHLSSSQRDCENGQTAVCTFWTETDYAGDSYSLCSLEVSRQLDNPTAFSVETDLGYDGIFKSWKCYDRDL